MSEVPMLYRCTGRGDDGVGIAAAALDRDAGSEANPRGFSCHGASTALS